MRRATDRRSGDRGLLRFMTPVDCSVDFYMFGTVTIDTAGLRCSSVARSFSAAARRRPVDVLGPFTELGEKIAQITHPVFSVAQLRFLAALGGGPPNALFFSGRHPVLEFLDDLRE